MKLHLSFVAARERVSGRIFMLAEYNALAAGGACANVAKIADQFRAGTPNGEDLRAKYSHVLVVIDNQERQSFEFPDPAIAERQQVELELHHVQNLVVGKAKELEKAKESAASIKELASDHSTALKRLNDLQNRLATLKANPVPVIQPNQVSQKSEPVKTPVEKPSLREQLAALNDEDLVTAAAEIGIPAPCAPDSSIDREGLIAELLAHVPAE
jgi:hypothetical protein